MAIGVVLGKLMQQGDLHNVQTMPYFLHAQLVSERFDFGLQAQCPTKQSECLERFGLGASGLVKCMGICCLNVTGRLGRVEFGSLRKS